MHAGQRVSNHVVTLFPVPRVSLSGDREGRLQFFRWDGTIQPGSGEKFPDHPPLNAPIELNLPDRHTTARGEERVDTVIDRVQVHRIAPLDECAVEIKEKQALQQ